MTKHLIDIDDDLLAAAQRELSTTGVSDTVGRALEYAIATSAQARLTHAASATSRGTWPPKFVGMIKSGPQDGSSPEAIDSVLGRGFGLER